jgi:hypothetical protein
MRFPRFLLLTLIAVCGLSATMYADCCRKTNGVTPVLLREYINSKRTIPLDEKDCNFSISGDIRTIWGHVVEQNRNGRLRGRGAQAICSTTGDKECGPFGTNDFDIIFDLYFDYACDRSWGVAWLQFDNPAGIERSTRPCSKDRQGAWGSGRCDGLCLRKAYLGYNVITDGCVRFDIEIGRRPLYTIFDSYVQFRSRFDGILLRYAANLPAWADFYINAGGFVIDEKVNHYGYVGETGLLNIAEFGWDLKYSFINWRKNGVNRCGERNPDGWRFAISQVTLQYNLDPNWFCMPVSIFGAYLYNHDAQKLLRTRWKKENVAWYVGLTAGQVCREGDWAAQVLYIQAQPQSVPDLDVYYIGNGNVLCESFTSETDFLNARGNSNFKGWRFEVLYGLTNNFSLDTFLEFSVPYEKRIGGRHNYSRFQVEGIYAF